MDLTERSEISKPEDIVHKILSALAYYGANVAVVVAHGDMPAVIAETLIKIATGEARSLRSPAKGEGYLVNLTKGEMINLSFEGEKEGVPQTPTVCSSQKDFVKGTNGEALKPVIQKPVEQISDNASEGVPFFDDNDIPF